MKFQQFAWVDLPKCWSNGGDQFINFFGSKFMVFHFGFGKTPIHCIQLIFFRMHSQTWIMC